MKKMKKNKKSKKNTIIPPASDRASPLDEDGAYLDEGLPDRMRGRRSIRTALKQHEFSSGRSNSFAKGSNIKNNSQFSSESSRTKSTVAKSSNVKNNSRSASSTSSSSDRYQGGGQKLLIPSEDHVAEGLFLGDEGTIEDKCAWIEEKIDAVIASMSGKVDPADRMMSELPSCMTELLSPGVYPGSKKGLQGFSKDFQAGKNLETGLLQFLLFHTVALVEWFVKKEGGSRKSKNAEKQRLGEWRDVQREKLFHNSLLESRIFGSPEQARQMGQRMREQKRCMPLWFYDATSLRFLSDIHKSAEFSVEILTWRSALLRNTINGRDYLPYLEPFFSYKKFTRAQDLLQKLEECSKKRGLRKNGAPDCIQRNPLEQGMLPQLNNWKEEIGVTWMPEGETIPGWRDVHASCKMSLVAKKFRDGVADEMTKNWDTDRNAFLPLPSVVRNACSSTFNPSSSSLAGSTRGAQPAMLKTHSNASTSNMKRRSSSLISSASSTTTSNGATVPSKNSKTENGAKKRKLDKETSTRNSSSLLCSVLPAAWPCNNSKRNARRTPSQDELEDYEIDSKDGEGLEHPAQMKNSSKNPTSTKSNIKDEKKYDGKRNNSPLPVFDTNYLKNTAGLTKTKFIPLVVARDVGFFRPDVFQEEDCYLFGEFAAAGWEIICGDTEAAQSANGPNRWDWKKCYKVLTKFADQYGFLDLWRAIQGKSYCWNVQVLEHQTCEFRKCARPAKNRAAKGVYDIDDPNRALAYMELYREFEAGALAAHCRARSVVLNRHVS